MRKILTLFVLMALLSGCTRTAAPDQTELTTNPTDQETTFATNPAGVDESTDPSDVEVQLLGEAGSLEEAQTIAELYGITLVEYKNGLGRFHTEEDPRDVIQRGKENGWPELVVNHVGSFS